MTTPKNEYDAIIQRMMDNLDTMDDLIEKMIALVGGKPPSDPKDDHGEDERRAARGE